MIGIPINTTPQLLCEGTCEQGMAHHPHTFVRRQRRTVARPAGEPDYLSSTIDDIFACDGCKAERVYGAASF